MVSDSYLDVWFMFNYRTWIGSSLIYEVEKFLIENTLFMKNFTIFIKYYYPYFNMMYGKMYKLPATTNHKKFNLFYIQTDLFSFGSVQKWTFVLKFISSSSHSFKRKEVWRKVEEMIKTNKYKWLSFWSHLRFSALLILFLGSCSLKFMSKNVVIIQFCDTFCSPTFPGMW